MKKCVAWVLVLIICLTPVIISGCNRKNVRNVQFVESSDPWYDYTELNIDDVYTGDNYDSVTQEYLTYTNNQHYLFANGIDEDGTIFENIDVYSDDGKLVKTVNLTSMLAPGEYIYYMNCVGDYFYAYTQKDGSNDVYEISVSMSDLSNVSRNLLDAKISDDDLFLDGVFAVDDNIIRVYSKGSGYVSVSYLLITNPDGRNVTVDMNSTPVGVQFESINGIFDIGDSQALLLGYVTGIGNVLYYIDLVTGTLSSIPDNDINWLRKEGVNPSDLRFSIVTAPGVLLLSDGRMLNYLEKTVSDRFSYNNSYLSESHGVFLNAVCASEGLSCVVYAGEINNMNDSYDCARFRIVKFTKCDKNPNEGKKIIKALNPNEFECDVIADYNMSNSEYYIRTMYLESDDYEKVLLSDEAPDIVFDYSSSGIVINEADYYIDLSEVLDTASVGDGTSYFDNVFKTQETDGKYYSVPLSFRISGYLVEKKYLKDDQYGFTYDEYVEFCDNTLNTRPKVSDKVNGFANSIQNQFDLYYDGETLNFDCQAFVDTANYYKDDVFNYIQSDFVVEDIPGSPSIRECTSCNFEWYLRELANIRIVGLPSYDSRGPEVDAYTISLTQDSAVEDETKKLVAWFLSPECQEKIVNMDPFEVGSNDIPVCVESYEKMARLQIDDFNSDVPHHLGYYGEYTETQIKMYHLDAVIEYSVIEDFKNNCFNASPYSGLYDSRVAAVLEEEIQAYFAGDKTIDQVIDIINRRAQLVVGERGT